MSWVGVIGYNFIEIPAPRIRFWLRTETIVIIFWIFTTLHILLLYFYPYLEFDDEFICYFCQTTIGFEEDLIINFGAIII